MIARKYVIFFLVLYVSLSVSFAYAALLSPFISKLAPAAAAATGAGGAFTIPAKVVATTSAGANVASWISLAVPGATAAKIAIALTGIAGALAADYIVSQEWFPNNLYKQDANGNFTKTETQQIPDGFTWDNFNGSNTGITFPGWTVVGHGMFPSIAAASAARNDFRAANCPSGNANTYTNIRPHQNAYSSDCSGAVRHLWFAPNYTKPSHPESGDVAKSKSDVENALAADLANEDAAAKKVAKAALDVTANAMDNPSHPVTNNTNVYNTINNYLTNNITANQLANLEAAATPNIGDQVLPDTEEKKVETMTAAQIAAAVQAALAGQGLSAAQIAAAVTAAQAAAGGGSLTPTQVQDAVATALEAQGLSADQIKDAIDSALPALGAYTGAFTANAWSKPVVGNFSNLFSNFLTNMKSTPLFSLPGLLSDSVPSGGSCEMSVNLSERFGGSKSISICNWETGLSGMKAVLLCIASIFAVGIVTKGGN